MMTTNTNRLPDGTTVQLPDGTIARAYAERGIGRPFAGTYYTIQHIGGVIRRDDGWRRDFLTPL